jgi:hypothetical protein
MSHRDTTTLPYCNRTSTAIARVQLRVWVVRTTTTTLSNCLVHSFQVLLNNQRSLKLSCLCSVRMKRLQRDFSSSNSKILAPEPIKMKYSVYLETLWQTHHGMFINRRHLPMAATNSITMPVYILTSLEVVSLHVIQVSLTGQSCWQRPRVHWVRRWLNVIHLLRPTNLWRFLHKFLH